MSTPTEEGEAPSVLPIGDIRVGDRRMKRISYKMPEWAPAPMLEQGAWVGDKGFQVLASVDKTPHGNLLHVSMSYPGHNPSWTDIKAVKEVFFGDTDAMMVLPRKVDYVNLHPFSFHLWQIPEKWGLR